MKLKDSIILILAVVAAIVAGVFAGIKLTENKYENNQQNDNKTESNEKLTLESAQELMDKYVLNDLCGEYYIDNLDEANMNYLSLHKVNAKKDYNCEQIYGKNYETQEEFPRSQCGMIADVAVYSYDEVLNKKRELFGSDINLEKQGFTCFTQTYDFVGSINSYVYLGAFGGGACMQEISNKLEVYDVVEDKDNIVYIYTKRTFVEDIDLSNNVSTDTKETITKNKYIFKKQDIGYYMATVEEIK